MIKKIIIFSLLLLTVRQAIAQSQNSTAGPISSTDNISPLQNSQVGYDQKNLTNGTDLFNTDLYNGSVNVSIPIYKYSLDGLNMGISLNYNTGGVRVNDISTPEGLGWSLSYGGNISREVMGIEDELSYHAMGAWWMDQGFKKHAIPSQHGQLIWIPYINQDAVYDVDSSYEHEPDRFTAVVGNQKFDFIVYATHATYLSHDVWRAATSPRANYGVIPLVNNLPINNSDTEGHLPPYLLGNSYDANYLSFEIVDGQGNQFFFRPGRMEDRSLYDNFLYFTYHKYIPEQWVLSQVITHTGQIINYKYTTVSIGYKASSYQEVTETQQNSYMNLNAGITLDTAYTQQWTGREYDISEIDYPNGTVAKFYYDFQRIDVPNAAALDSIVIQKKYDDHLGNSYTYQFIHNYSYSGTPSFVMYPHSPVDSNDQLMYRLRLNSIDKIGTDKTTRQLYFAFDYDDNPLPPRLSPFQDCYGYSNGSSHFVQATKLSNNADETGHYAYLGLLSLSRHALYTKDYQGDSAKIEYGIDRSSNFDYAKVGDLMSITNGTGGKISFDYKPNVVSAPDLGNPANHAEYYSPTEFFVTGIADRECRQQPDGICIDHITVTDGYNPDDSTSYHYSFSGGEVFQDGGYFWFPIQGLGGYSGYPSQDSGGVWVQRKYTNEFVAPINYLNGFNHGYRDAVVKTVGYNGQITDWKEYKFSGVIPQPGEVDSIVVRYGDGSQTGLLDQGYARIQNRCGLFTHTMPPVYMDKNFLGLPVETDQYDPTGNLLTKTVNEYNKASSIYFNDPAPTPDSLMCIAFPEYSFITLPCSRYFSMDDNQLVVQGKYSTICGDAAQLMQTTIYNHSAGQTRTNVIKYNYNYFGNLASKIWTDSWGNNFINLYSYQDMFYTPFPGYDCSWHILDGVENHENNGVIDARTDDFYLFSQNYFNRLNTKTVYIDNYINSYNGLHLPSLYQAKLYSRYDDHHNVLETWADNSTKVSSTIWDTRIGQKLAVAKYAAYNDIAYTSFEGNFKADSDFNKGNWVFDSSQVIYNPANKPITGNYYYQLQRSPSVSVSTLDTLTTGKKYLLSFWAQGSTAPVVTYYVPSGGTTVLSPLPLTAQQTINGWTCYYTYFTGMGQPLRIGTDFLTQQGAPNININIDELRLCPVDAIMDTYTYDPLLGISSHTDEHNNITYYSYDPMGHLKTVRDINGNILSLTKTVIQGTDN